MLVLQKEQLESHELQLAQLEQELNEHKKGPIPSKGLPLQNYKEKESYLQYEVSVVHFLELPNVTTITLCIL